MKSVRHNVWETNSSSTHSVSINSYSGVYESISPDKEGIITLKGGQFGWEWSKYTDALTKANYCAVHAGENDSLRNMLRDVILDHTGAKDIVFDIVFSWSEDREYSGIDHQSLDTAEEAFSSKENLKNFIFNPESVLYTGNDNTMPPPNFYDSEKDLAKKQFVLSLEGTSKTVRIESENDKEVLHDELTRLFQYNIWNEYQEREEEIDFSTFDFLAKKEKRFQIPSFLSTKEDESWIDYNNKTVTVVQEKNHYSKKGEYLKTTVENSKTLTWKITKL